MVHHFGHHPRDPRPTTTGAGGSRLNNDRRSGAGGYSAGGRRYQGQRPDERRVHNNHGNRVREVWARRQRGGNPSLLGRHSSARSGDANVHQVQDRRGQQVHNAASAVNANHHDAHRNNNFSTNVTDNVRSDTSPSIQALLDRNRALLSSINTAAGNTTTTAPFSTPPGPNTLTAPANPAFTSLSEDRKVEALAERRRMQLRRDEAIAAAKIHKPYQYKGNDPIKKRVRNEKLRALLAGRKVPGPPKRHDAMVLKLGPKDMGFEYVEELLEEEEQEKE